MWQYRYTDELYHYGVPGMRWGHRKRSSNIISKAFKSDIEDVRTRVGNFKNRHKKAISDFKNTKGLNRYKAYKKSLNNSYELEDKQRIKTLKNRADKYGRNTARTINVGKHVAGIAANVAVSKYAVQYGGRIIADNWNNPYISKGRKMAAIVLVGSIASIPLSYAIQESKTTVREDRIQRKYKRK